MKEHFLVTGASGFVGNAIVRRLLDLRQDVSVLVRKKNLNWRLSDIASQLDVNVVDLLDPNLSTVIRKIRPSVVFHLAAYGAMPNETDVERMIDVNIKGLLNLVRAVKKIPLKLFINTGSSSEYGIKSLPMRETDVLAPINDYGVTKSAMTLFCQKISRVEQLPIVTFRLFSPFGQYEGPERFVPSVISALLINKRLTLSSRHNVRDFIYVEDVVEAYIQAVERKISLGSIVNIGSGKQHRLEDVVNIVRKYTKSTSRVVWDPKKSQSRQIEPKRWQANIDLAKSVLKWEPIYTLEAGLQKTIDWMKQMQNPSE